MFKIIDNYLEIKDHLILKTLMESNTFPWFFMDKKVSTSSDIFNFQLFHIFYKDNEISSNFYNNLKPLIDKLNPKTLVRIKANLNPLSHQLIKYNYHKDQDFECKVAIYYLNTNNGYTMLEDKKVESKANRMVLFDSSVSHYGTNSTNCPNRTVINFNYF